MSLYHLVEKAEDVETIIHEVEEQGARFLTQVRHAASPVVHLYFEGEEWDLEVHNEKVKSGVDPEVFDFLVAEGLINREDYE